MAAYTRKQYSGAARNTTTTTLLTNVGTTVDIAATTGWPSIAGIPFYVVINPSSIYEEKCLATISGSTLTLTRAQDDTTASEHPIGSVIYPVFTANDADEANELVSKLTTKGDLLVTDGSALHRLGVGANGFFLKANSSASVGLEWASIPTINSLDDVGDVTITDLEGGDILTYSNSASAWVNETVHFLTVSDTEPTDEVQEGDLWYNSSELELYTYYSGSWIQVTLTPEFPTVEELDNVYISTASTGDVLAFDGLDWYNDTVSNLLGSHIIALSGDVSGSVLFDSSASVSIATTIQPNSVALGIDTTGDSDDVTEGTTNLYFTDGRARTALLADNNGTADGIRLIAPNTGTVELISHEATRFVRVTSNATAGGGKIELAGSTQIIASPSIADPGHLTVAGSVFVGGGVVFEGDTANDYETTVVVTDPTADRTITLPNADGTIALNGSIALGADTTGNYMSDLTQGTGVTITHTPGEGSNATIAIGQAVATSSSVSFARLETTGDIVVGGNLTVNGTTTTLNTETLLVEDNIVVLNSGITASPTLNAGIEVERGDSANVLVRWNESTDSWELTEDGSTYKNIAVGQDVETSSSVTFANVTSNLIGDVTGNADTATALETARTIELSGDVSGSASFDGTANINLFTTVNTASVAIGELYGVNITSPEEFQTLEYDGTEWVNQYASVVSYVRNAEATTITAGTPVYLFGGNGDHASVKRADNTTDATSSKTVGLAGASIAASENGPVITRGYVDGVDLSMYVAGDVLWLGKNGQVTTTKPSAPDHLVFIGVVIRATINGIVYVATQNGYELEELHDVKINGVTDGQFLRYNSASVVWVNDTINLGTDTAGDYVQNLTAGTGVTLSNNSGEGAIPTVAIGQDVATSASVTFANVSISGRIDKTTIRESVADTSVSASVVTADYATGDIFYVGTAPGSNFTVNLTNAPTDDGKAITVVIFVTQGATGYIPNAVQVAGSAQTIKWANGAAPTPTSSAGKIDIFSFTFVRRSSAWTVFGSSNLGY